MKWIKKFRIFESSEIDIINDLKDICLDITDDGLLADVYSWNDKGVETFSICIERLTAGYILHNNEIEFNKISDTVYRMIDFFKTIGVDSYSVFIEDSKIESNLLYDENYINNLSFNIFTIQFKILV